MLKLPIDPLLQQHLNLSNSLGPELTTNGTFTGSASGWTLGAAWAYSANTAVKNADGTTTAAQTLTIATNKVYLITFVVSAWTVGTVTVSLGGTSGTARGANGTYREYIKTANATGALTFTPTNTARFTLDTVSVKEVGTAPADQVTVWVEDQGGTAGKATLYIRGENGTVVGIGGDGFTFGANDEDLTLAYIADTLTLAGGVFIVPSGVVGAVSLGVGAADTGLYSTSAARLDIAVQGTRVVSFNNVDLFFISSTGGLNWDDAALKSEGPNILQQGSDAAAPSAQTYKGPDARAGTDTNTVGGDMTIAPGRSTGTAAGGVLYLATSPKGATGTAANALVNRVQLDFEGIAGFSPQDAAATPVEPTAPLKLFAHNKSVADDAVVTLPSVTTCGHGTVHVGGGDPGTAGFPFTNFFVDGSGNVVLLDATLAADVSANTDTDGDLCIGTADPQEPVQVKNRLAGTKVLNIMFWYD